MAFMISQGYVWATRNRLCKGVRGDLKGESRGSQRGRQCTLLLYHVGDGCESGNGDDRNDESHLCQQQMYGVANSQTRNFWGSGQALSDHILNRSR